MSLDFHRRQTKMNIFLYRAVIVLSPKMKTTAVFFNDCISSIFSCFFYANSNLVSPSKNMKQRLVRTLSADFPVMSIFGHNPDRSSLLIPVVKSMESWPPEEH